MVPLGQLSFAFPQARFPKLGTFSAEDGYTEVLRRDRLYGECWGHMVSECLLYFVYRVKLPELSGTSTCCLSPQFADPEMFVAFTANEVVGPNCQSVGSGSGGKEGATWGRNKKGRRATLKWGQLLLLWEHWQHRFSLAHPVILGLMFF